jgi:hypothetical protein
MSTAVQNEINATKADFIDLTHQLNNYNEIYNLNVYLQKMHNVELDQLSSKDQKMKTTSLKYKQKYFLTDYAVKRYGVLINLMYFTIVVLCSIIIISALFMLNKMERTSLFTYTVLILLLWAFVLIIVVKVNADRRRYAYDQYYWSEVKKTE